MYGVYSFEQPKKVRPQSVKGYDYLTILDNSKFRKRVNMTLFPVLFLAEADLEILKFEFLVAVFMEFQVWSDVMLSLGEKVPTFRRIGCLLKVGNLPSDTVYHVIRPCSFLKNANFASPLLEDNCPISVDAEAGC